MSGKRSKRLMEEARKKAMDGSVIKSHEYKRLKRSYNNIHYAPVVVLAPTKSYLKFSAWYKMKLKKAS